MQLSLQVFLLFCIYEAMLTQGILYKTFSNIFFPHAYVANEHSAIQQNTFLTHALST
jgi:hypothetical protein